MNIAIIDIGSNTIRLNIYTYENNELKLLFGKKNTAGLVSYVKEGYLTDKGILKLSRVLKTHGNIINSVKHDRIYVFATASLRNIKNTQEVLSYVKEMTDMEIEIIDQRQEARLGFEGILSSIDVQTGVTVDIGGGSTEIIKFKDKKIVDMFNLKDGSLSLYNRYVSGVLPKDEEVKEMQKIVKKELKDAGLQTKSKTIIGIGGTIRAIGNVSQEMYRLSDNTRFTVKNTEDLYQSLMTQDKATIQTVLQVKPERIHTMIPGMTIFNQLCTELDAKDVIVSETGLREGVVYEKLRLEGK